MKCKENVDVGLLCLIFFYLFLRFRYWQRILLHISVYYYWLGSYIFKSINNNVNATVQNNRLFKKNFKLRSTFPVISSLTLWFSSPIPTQVGKEIALSSYLLIFWNCTRVIHIWLNVYYMFAMSTFHSNINYVIRFYKWSD